MHIHRSQQGMTAIGWIIVLMLIGFVTLVTLKIFPIYMGGFTVSSAVNSLKSDRTAVGKTPAELKVMLLKRLDINMVSTVKREDIRIERSKNSNTVMVDYEVRENIFGNLDVVVSFSESAEVPN